MTLDEIKNAVKYAENHCRVLENGYKDDVIPYEMASARNVLKCLNYTTMEQNEILEYMHLNGFNYCLDVKFPHEGNYPPEHACWWGIDQLRSRLSCVR